MVGEEVIGTSPFMIVLRTEAYNEILQATHLMIRLNQIAIEDHIQMLWRSPQRQTHHENQQRNHQIL